MDEKWLPVVGFEQFYEVSDHGHVRSLDRIITRRDGRRPYLKHGRLLRLSPNTSGHLQVVFSVDGQTTMPLVHRLVLQAFVGPCPDGFFALHWDDNPVNNKLGNLRYGTRSDNAQDSLRNGRHHQAAKTHCKFGHEFDARNTIWRKTGGRACRVCQARCDARLYAKKYLKEKSNHQ